MAPNTSLTDAQNGMWRMIANRICNDRFKGNVNAFGHELDVSQPSLRRFLRGEGGTSIVTAKKIARMAGLKYSDDIGQLRVDDVEVTPAQGIAPGRGPRKTQQRDEELEKTLDFFEGRWSQATASSARALALQYEIHLSRIEWQQGLDEIEKLLTDWVTKHSHRTSKNPPEHGSGGHHSK